ncbi:hypothetical protein BURKHO8Y_50004 [Burkholderia sp. 8Y]|nr:hypothetical protein BURKHO8Y_50004 [Burkholderia sp. 8Y]
MRFPRLLTDGKWRFSSVSTLETEGDLAGGGRRCYIRDGTRQVTQPGRQTSVLDAPASRR